MVRGVTVITDEISVSQLRELVYEASRENPHLTSRLEKAAFLVLLRPIEALGTSRFLVRSEDGLRFYEVRNGHCECSDYIRHGPGHPCKHRLALSFLSRLTGVPIHSGNLSEFNDASMRR